MNDRIRSATRSQIFSSNMRAAGALAHLDPLLLLTHQLILHMNSNGSRFSPIWKDLEAIPCHTRTMLLARTQRGQACWRISMLEGRGLLPSLTLWIRKDFDESLFPYWT